MVTVKKVFEDMSDEEKLEEAKRVLELVRDLMDRNADKLSYVNGYRYAGKAKKVEDKINELLENKLD